MMLSDSLHLGGQASVKYQLSPTVVLNVLDHFKRRVEGLDIVVGTLLGVKRGNSIVIADCFPVIYHVESEEKGLFDEEYHNQMLAMKLKMNPENVVVGWYQTGNKITYLSSLVHKRYYTDCSNPVLLTVDTALTDNRMAVKAYTGNIITRTDPIVIANHQAATDKTDPETSADVMASFVSVPLEYCAHESDKTGVDAMINASPVGHGLDAPATFLGDMDSLEHSLIKLRTAVDTLQLYVQQVQDGKIEGDPVLGRRIANVLAQVPYMNPQVFNDNVQDLLMIVYLANITRTQIALSHKIHSLS